MSDELAWCGLTELRRRIVQGEVSPVEATELALTRAATVGAELNAFTYVDADGARRVELALASGSALGALFGVPITIKDLMLTRGIPTTAGSRAELALPSDRDAPVVKKLRRAGAIVIGKNNLNEFAYGVTGENAHFGDVPNPWDRTRMPGGSSGGSGASLACGIGYGSVGTDTRGSIRIPSSCCGVSGIKPTRGLVPTEDVFPLSWTLDHTGPMARSVEDLALMLGVMAGGRGAPGRFRAALERPVRGMKLGVVGFFMRDLDAEVGAAVRAAIDALADAGLDVLEIEIPELEACLRASAVITACEGTLVHDERLKAGGAGYGPPVLKRLENAYGFSGLDLARAEATRRTLIQAYTRAFEGVDCMVGPTLPGAPARRDGTTMRVGGGREEWVVDASCRLVAPGNMTGVPAASLPCGFSREGLPIGLQLWAAFGADDVVLSVGHRYQERTDWHRRRPPLGAGVDSRPSPHASEAGLAASASA